MTKKLERGCSMGLFDFLRARDAPKPDVKDMVSQAMRFPFGFARSGEPVNPRTAVQLSTVYACVRVISETVASLPLAVYETLGEGGSKRAINHPLDRIIHDEANSEMTSFTWRETALSHLLLWGNSYSQIMRARNGKIVGLYPLLPENMVVDRDADGKLIYTYTTDTGITQLTEREVLHIPGLGFDGLIGYSPVAMERNAMGLSLAAEEYGSSFFRNGAIPAGILTVPQKVKDPDRLRAEWIHKFGGNGNKNKVAVLEEGMKFEQISMPNNEAQFLETRKFQVDEICRIFRVPPNMIGHMEHSTYNNAEQQSLNFVVYTIRPWLVRIEQAMNKTLFSKEEKGAFFTRFNVDGLLRGDYKSRMEGYAIARQNGFMSANDIRDLEGWNPIPDSEGGNAYLVNGNMISITTAANQTTTNQRNGGDLSE